MWGWGRIETLWQDVRFGMRILRKNPGFSLVAVLTLALGIGANTAIFSVVNGVLLRPLPYAHPDRIVALWQTSKAGDRLPMAWPNYTDLQARQTVFEAMGAAVPVGMILTGVGEPQRFVGKWVTSSFFKTLEVQPQLGRLFTAAEDQRNCERVIVLTHGFWQQHFGGRADILGRQVTLSSETWTVVGVLRPDFEFYGTGGNNIFYPMGRLLNQDYMYSRTANPLLWLVARLKAQVTLQQAQTEIGSLAAELAAQHPETDAGKSVRLQSLAENYVGDLRSAFLTLLGAVALVLLIACANVANMLLARSATRRKEMALRMALGAGRGRIVRQLLTESLLLALAGGAAGIALAKLGLAALIALDPPNVPRLYEVQLDGRALWFTLLATFVAGVIFGLAPALQTTRSDLHDRLKDGGRTSPGGSRRLRQSLVVAEVALALLLLVGAGLLLRSFQRMLDVDPGFDAHNVLTIRLRLPDAKYKEAAQTVGFLQQAEARVAALPGVQAVSFSNGVPLAGSASTTYQVEGQSETVDVRPVAINRPVSTNYHQTLGIRLLAGRALSAQDDAHAQPVAIVDEIFVRRHFPGQPFNEVLNKRVRLAGDGEPWRVIVGVVRRVKQSGLDVPELTEIYQPYLQIPPRWLADMTRSMDIVVRTSSDPHGLVAAIRKEVQAIDPQQPLANVRTLEEYLTDRSSARRFNLLLLGVFAAVALLLGTIGIYGVMAYGVAERTQEIGIRMALGAPVRHVLGLVLAQGMKLVFAGILLGSIGAFALMHLLESLLFGVSATDPLTFAVVAMSLAVAAMLACLIPAWRATTVDPLIALRHE
ncbi:MAG TPA: ABC transporter permease [Blastocatellia bacterium]|nr:ABC transporter permease [Blastocatellia bacterium]